MTRNENKAWIAAVKELMGANLDALRKIVQDLLQEMLEAEMTEALGASKSERVDGRVPDACHARRQARVASAPGP